MNASAFQRGLRPEAGFDLLALDEGDRLPGHQNGTTSQLPNIWNSAEKLCSLQSVAVAPPSGSCLTLLSGLYTLPCLLLQSVFQMCIQHLFPYFWQQGLPFLVDPEIISRKMSVGSVLGCYVGYIEERP